jgi:hypothetical protein
MAKAPATFQGGIRFCLFFPILRHYSQLLLSMFPGLRPGDRWCLCALRWKEALEAGVAPPVVLAASHEAALRYVSIEVLNQHALDGQNRIHKPEPDK